MGFLVSGNFSTVCATRGAFVSARVAAGLHVHVQCSWSASRRV